MAELRLVVGAATDVGRVREVNEDGYLVDESIGLYAIADGVGGHRAGEIASATALETLRAAIRNGRALREAMADANEAVYAKAQTDDDYRGMGTTLTAGTLASGNTLIIGNVGDSRAYLLRDGRLRQLTTDHSRVQELVEQGQLSADEAAVHPMRNIITRAIGMDDEVDVDVFPLELLTGDRVLFCSDGLTDMVSDEQVGTELRREDDPGRAATRLVEVANQAGGVDNVTVLVIRVGNDDTGNPAAPAPETAVISPMEPTRVEPAPAAREPTDEAATRKETRRERRARRRPVLRTLVWTAPVLAILGVAVGAIAWYARTNYYVGPDGSQVVVYQGVPGGLLWWNPTIAGRTTLRIDELGAADATDVRGKPTFSSRQAAEDYVRRLRARAGATPTTTASTTTTTQAPTTTTLLAADAPTAPAGGPAAGP